MNTKIKDFCEKYQDKLRFDKSIAKDKQKYSFHDYRDRISFNVNMTIYTPNIMLLGGFNHGTIMMKLDAEDLKYLYNKYSKKIIDEMEENIQKIKNEYKKII